MIGIKCERCKKRFKIDIVNRKGRLPKYCPSCSEIKRYKHLSKEEIKIVPYNKRKLIMIDNTKVTDKLWIVDDNNIPKCYNCDANITDTNENIIDNNVTYDIKHGDLICKKCGLIIGKLELRGYIKNDMSI